MEFNNDLSKKQTFDKDQLEKLGIKAVGQNLFKLPSGQYTKSADDAIKYASGNYIPKGRSGLHEKLDISNYYDFLETNEGKTPSEESRKAYPDYLTIDAAKKIAATAIAPSKYNEFLQRDDDEIIDWVMNEIPVAPKKQIAGFNNNLKPKL